MRKFTVSSRSKIGIFHIVEVDVNKIVCNCPAGKRGLDCNHKILIKDFLNSRTLSFKELSRIHEINEDNDSIL